VKADVNPSIVEQVKQQGVDFEKEFYDELLEETGVKMTNTRSLEGNMPQISAARAFLTNFTAEQVGSGVETR
jgi:hypothetical protein